MARKKQQTTLKQDGPVALSDRDLATEQADKQLSQQQMPNEEQDPNKPLTYPRRVQNAAPSQFADQDAIPLASIRHRRLSTIQKTLIISIALIVAMLLYVVLRSLLGPAVSPTTITTDLAASAEQQTPAADQSSLHRDSFGASASRPEQPLKDSAQTSHQLRNGQRTGLAEVGRMYTNSIGAGQTQRPRTTPHSGSAEASSLRIAEIFYRQKDFNKAYAVYNRLRQNLPPGPEEDPLRDFLQLKMAFCMKKAGDIEQAARLFRAVLQSRFPVVRITASYHQSTDLMQKKQYLKARIKAYQAIALIDAVDWALANTVPDRHGALRLARDCHFLAAECLTRDILSLCDADKDLPSQFWPRSFEFAPFANLTETQLRRLLSSGSEQLRGALLAPRIQPVGGGQRDNLTSRWEVSCHGASIEELLARFAAHAGLDIQWVCDGPASIVPQQDNSDSQNHGEGKLHPIGARTEAIANSVIMRSRPVSLYMSAVTAQQFVTVAAGCVGLLARLDDEGIVTILNPSNYTSLSEHIALLSRQAILLWQKFLLTSDDERVPIAHFAVGLLQAQRGHLTDAIAEYKLVANRYAQTSLAPLALLHSSKLRISLRDYFGAREDLKQLIERYPNSEFSDQACVHLAEVTMKAGLLHEASRLYRKVYNLGFSLESQSSAALGAGRCFYEREDYENAAYWLTRYINLAKDRNSRDFYLACFLLGKAKLAQGLYQQAFDALQHALTGRLLAQEYVQAVSTLVKAYVQQGRFVEALELLENVRSRQLSQKESIEILLLKANVFRSVGLVDEAIALLGDRAQYLPNSQLKAKISFEHAKCSIAKGDLELARKNLTEILVLIEPGALAREVRYELADVCLKLGQNAQAISICLQLLDSAPETPIKQKALDLLATAYTRQKKYDKAALALLGQWNQTENTKTKGNSGKSNREDITSRTPMKQDTQHNEG